MAKKVLCLILSSLLAVGMLSACANSANDSAENTETSSSQNGAVEQTENAGEPVYGGVLRVSPGAQSENQIGYPVGANTNNQQIMNAAPALEPLFKMEADGTIIPWLAKGYDVTEDGLVYTIYLNEGIKFHDGYDFNAEAVVKTIELSLGEGQELYLGATEYKALDEYTVEITFEHPSPLLIANMAKAAIMSPYSAELNGKEWAEKNPVGTGPFKFVSYEERVKIVFERNEDYWRTDENGNKLPYLDGIEVIYFEDSTVASVSLKNDEIDVYWGATPEMLQEFEVIPDFSTYMGSVADAYMHLTPDTANPDSIVSDVRVRQAVAHAIDMETIVVALFGETAGVINQNSLEGNMFYSDNVTGYEYNPEKAKQLLAEAGYADGCTIEIYGEAGDVFDKLAVAMQGYLEEVGITLHINALDGGGFFNALSTFQDGFMMGGFSHAPVDASIYYGLMNRNSPLRMKPNQMTEEALDLLDQVALAKDLEACAEVYQKLMDEVFGEKLQQIPLIVRYVGVVKDDSIMNLGMATMGTLQLWNPESVWIAK